jgi:hypothetical protein
VRGFYWLRGSEGQRDEEAEPPAEDRRSGRIGRGSLVLISRSSNQN